MSSSTALDYADSATDFGRSDLQASTNEDRWRTALVALGRRAVASADTELLMHDAAAMLAESLDADVSGVAELVEDGAKLCLQLRGARDGVELAAAKQSIAVKRETSLAAFVLAEGGPLAVPDLSRETRFQDAFLRKHGVASAVACPLKLPNKSYGALLVANLRPQPFHEEDLLFVEAIGHLITTTIAKERAEQALANQLRLDAAVLDTIEALVVVLDPETRIAQFNRSCEEIAGFSLAELHQRLFCSAFLVPSEVRSVKETLDKLLQPSTSGPVEFESYVLTKHGTRRRIAWAFTRLTDAQGALESLVGTGIDITEKYDLEAKLAKAHALAGEKTQAVADMAAGTTAPAAGNADGKAAATPQTEEEALKAARPFQQLPPGVYGERRARPRRAYPYVQLIAPIIDGQLPPRSEFREVQCRDIAAGGFSFFAPAAPQEAELVVAFGAGTSMTFLTARQVHTTPTTRDGKPCVIVGCRYTGRASYKA